MYHNGEDISAYLDGELPADTARELERRLETDAAAREELERFRGLRTTLQDPETPDFDASHERVWTAIESRLGLKPPLWRRRVSLPFPAVAAAAVAVFALAGLLLWFADAPVGSAGSLAGEAVREAEARLSVRNMDGEELLGWLQDSDLAGEVSMELPEGARFEIMGEPQLMKATDFHARGESPDG